MEAAEIDELRELAFEGWVSGSEVKRICKDEPAAGDKMPGSGREQILDELAKVRDGNAFSHGRVGNDQADLAGIEVAKVGCNQLSVDL